MSDDPIVRGLIRFCRGGILAGLRDQVRRNLERRVTFLGYIPR